MLVTATPALASAGSGSDARLGAATFAYVIGSFVCHQRPERSFHAGAFPFPVCARCQGVYAGAAAAVLIAIAWPRARRSPVARPAGWWRAVLIAAAAPTAATIVLEWMTPVPISNAVRAAAGVLAGAAVAALVVASAGRSRKPEVN